MFPVSYFSFLMEYHCMFCYDSSYVRTLPGNLASIRQKHILWKMKLFFILRKKFSQVSTLHVIHHGIMPMSVWMGMKFAPGGHSTFFAMLNTFVHIVMYFYYMLSALGPEYQKYIWWKKYLTAFQMAIVRVKSRVKVKVQYIADGLTLRYYGSTNTATEEKNSGSQNGYAKPTSNGATGYTKTVTESAYSNVYYSNGINNGFMSTKPIESSGSCEPTNDEPRKTK
ncbi:hypothetical protein V9T40_003570 [Parthenolecanium corni]|uniref:Elongation of very long chain fatty acids protein n=1 Tax=Parthenolecanium corni TaxID=536013 RepID=A0AAN9TVC4_9HEMI